MNSDPVIAATLENYVTFDIEVLRKLVTNDKKDQLDELGFLTYLSTGESISENSHPKNPSLLCVKKRQCVAQIALAIKELGYEYPPGRRQPMQASLPAKETTHQEDEELPRLTTDEYERMVKEMREYDLNMTSSGFVNWELRLIITLFQS